MTNLELQTLLKQYPDDFQLLYEWENGVKNIEYVRLSVNGIIDDDEYLILSGD